MRALVPILALLGASGCDFGDNRPLRQADCDGVDPCAGPDAGGGGERGGDAAAELDGGPDRPDADVEEEACRLVAQSGCPAGMACDLDGDERASGDTECRAIDEEGNARSLCETAEECGAGFTCVSDPAGGASCLAFCEVEGDCPGAGGACDVELVDDNGDPIPGGTLCTQSCNPINSNGCPGNWGCRVATHHTECRPAGRGRHLDPCAGDADCDTGFSCVGVASDTVCLRNCRVGVLGVCSALAGTTCARYAEPAIIGGIEYGACF